MPEQVEVDWRAIARNRWPMYKIRGHGSFAAMPRGEGTIYLFNTVFERTRHAPPHLQFLTLRPSETMRKTGSD